MKIIPAQEILQHCTPDFFIACYLTSKQLKGPYLIRKTNSGSPVCICCEISRPLLASQAKFCCQMNSCLSLLLRLKLLFSWMSSQADCLALAQ